MADDPTSKATGRPPKMLDRIIEAIQAQPPSHKGVSITVIQKYIIAKYDMKSNIKNSLRKGLLEGETMELLVRPKGSEAIGLTGSYKVNKTKLAAIEKEKEKNKKEKLMAKRAEIKEKTKNAKRAEIKDKAKNAKKTEKPTSRGDKPRKKAAAKENESPKKSPKKTPTKPAAKKSSETKSKKSTTKSSATKTPKKMDKKGKKAAATPREKLKSTKSKKLRS